MLIITNMVMYLYLVDLLNIILNIIFINILLLFLTLLIFFLLIQLIQ